MCAGPESGVSTAVARASVARNSTQRVLADEVHGRVAHEPAQIWSP